VGGEDQVTRSEGRTACDRSDQDRFAVGIVCLATIYSLLLHRALADEPMGNP
jgi:hypothetical protein